MATGRVLQRWCLGLALALSVSAVAVIKAPVVLAQDAMSAESLVKKANQLLKEKSYERAEAVFREALAKDPRSVAAYEGLGDALAGRRQWEDAIKVYKNGLEAIPDWHRGLYLLGYTYRKMGEYEDAIKFYQQYIIVTPDDPDAYYGLGQSHHKAGNNAKAVEAFKIYVEKEKRPAEQKWVARAKEIIDSVDLADDVAADGASGGEEGGEDLQDEGASDAAVVDVVEGPAAEGALADLLKRGDMAFEASNPTEAVRFYRGAARQDAGIEALYKLGVTLAISGDLVGAIGAWDKVLERQPDMAAASENIARARQKLKAQADKGVDDPRLGQGVEAQLELAASYAEAGRHAMALRVLDPLSDQHPDDHGVRLSRGRSLMALGRYEEAAQDLELALGSDPGDGRVLGALGEVYVHLADPGRALYFLKRYLERVDPAGRNAALDQTRKTVARLEASLAR